MTDRDKLSGYPCPTHMHHHDVCDGDCAWRAMCDLKPIYDAHIKLRTAVLGNLPPEVAAYIYRNAAQLYGERANEEAKARFMALADVVEKLGA